jgi:hypothetical protein
MAGMRMATTTTMTETTTMIKNDSGNKDNNDDNDEDGKNNDENNEDKDAVVVCSFVGGGGVSCDGLDGIDCGSFSRWQLVAVVGLAVAGSGRGASGSIGGAAFAAWSLVLSLPWMSLQLASTVVAILKKKA